MRVNKYIDTVTIAEQGLSTGVRPRYRAIAASLSQAILEGRVGAGTKLPPLRLLADRLQVTVGTIGRAYAEIERQGLVASRVGDGTYVVRPGERLASAEFENAPQLPDAHIDLSRNTHIPSDDVNLLMESLARLAADRRRIGQLSDYLPDAGLALHREAGAQWLRLSGVPAEAERVIVTNGAQHGLLCTLMALLRRDDLVVSEHLSYPGLVAAARALGLRLAGIPIDAEGLMPGALEDFCAQQKVHALYCTPSLHNPTTAVMSSARRQAIAQICLRHHIKIIEDDAHGVLVEPHPQSLAVHAPNDVVTLTSLSKAVSAGLRVGFVGAPRAFVGRIASAVRSSCWMATPLNAEIGAAWILNGHAARLRELQRQEIRRRKALVRGLVEEFRPDTHPDCSHYWITLPESWRAGEFTAQLEERGVLVKDAEAFAIGRLNVPQCVRVSVSTPADDATLVRGFELLAELMRDAPFRTLD